jgi:hypothetical protein
MKLNRPIPKINNPVSLVRAESDGRTKNPAETLKQGQQQPNAVQWLIGLSGKKKQDIEQQK